MVVILFATITGRKAAEYFKCLWGILAFVGSIASLSFVWNISDAFNGLMAIPNLIALIALSPVVFVALKEHEKSLKKRSWQGMVVFHHAVEPEIHDGSRSWTTPCSTTLYVQQGL